MTTYRSKIGIGTLLSFIIVVSGVCVLEILHQDWISLIVILLIVALAIYIFRSAYCTITGNVLNIRFAFFIDTDIDINTIKSVMETNSIWSAPALPVNRLEIFYNNYDSIIISTPDKAQFVADLRAINPNITITWRNKK